MLQSSGFGLESSVKKYVQRAQAKSPAIARLSGHTRGRATALESLLGTVKGKLRLSFPCLGCLGPGVFQVWGFSGSWNIFRLSCIEMLKAL